MIVELGHFATIVAFVMAVGLAAAGYASATNAAWRSAAGTLATGQLALLIVGFAALVQAFVASDFSVAYVAENSNTLLPLVLPG